MDTTPEPAAGGAHRPEDQRQRQASGDYSVVLLLSQHAQQDANKSLLRSRDFAPYVYETLASVRDELERQNDICGCCIDRTFLRDLHPAAQRELFAMLGRYSSLIWIRVDEGELGLSNLEVREILRRARCLPELPSSALSLRPDGVLCERELEEIERARTILRSHGGAQFVPGELEPEQARLIIAAARLHAEQVTRGAIQTPIRITTQFLGGGRSGVQVMLVRVQADHQPVVMKIAPKEAVLNELDRFQCFVAPFDDELRPQAYFHGKAALLLFGLLPRAEDRDRPAVMLSEALEALWNDQLFGRVDPDTLERRADNLTDAIRDTARRLVGMNRRPPADPTYACNVNPPAAYLERFERDGLHAGLVADGALARQRAAERMRRLEKAGTVHGDAHLNNVLVRGDRTAHLIDYAASGPGHPAVDLVRLEVALFTGAMHQLEPETVCVEFQQRMSIDLANEAELETRFEGMYRCRLNRTCLRGCVAARDAAISAVSAHGGDPDDYLAVKLLVAWQALYMPGKHTGMARAIIQALTPTVASWPEHGSPEAGLRVSPSHDVVTS